MPVCFGAKDDSYGRFVIKERGLINTFKLIHLNGSLTCHSSNEASFWGCLTDSVAVQLKYLHTIITFKNKTALPLADFVRGRWHCGGQYYKYVLEGFHANSGELVFKQLYPKLNVSAGQEFQIWYGEDWKNCWEGDNNGKTWRLCVVHLAKPTRLQNEQGLSCANWVQILSGYLLTSTCYLHFLLRISFLFALQKDDNQ